MAENVLKFDFVADDKGASLTITNLGKKFTDLADKTDKVNAHTSKLSATFAKLQSPALKAAASIASLSGALAPAALGMVALAKSAAVVGTQLAPAAAALPAFAAGAVLVKQTLTSIGPAMAKSFAPVTDAFAKSQAQVDKLATKGLPALARRFTKVNFPQIHTAMKGIAAQTNSVVVAVGKWVNSTAGQSAIGSVLKGTLGVTKQLAAVLPGVVTSFGNMVARAAGPGFAALGSAGGFLDKLASGAVRLFDSVSGADVQRAFDAIAGYGEKFLAFGRVVVDVGVWMSQNTAKVKAFSDALAVLGVAIGLLSGNWIAVVVGGLTLLANHWDTVNAAASRVAGSFGQVGGAGSALGGIVADLSSWWSDRLLPALQRAGSDLLPTLRTAAESVTKTLKDNKETVAKVQGVLAAMGVVLTEVVIPALTVAAQVVIPAVTGAFSILVLGINRVVLPAIRILTKIFLDSLGSMLHAAAWLLSPFPGLGDELKEAARKFDNFKAKTNAALDGIQKNVDVTVKVTVHRVTINDKPVTIKTDVRGASISTGGRTVQARAGGGPVLRGQPYLVGEQGPELFTPGRSGRISDARTTAAMNAGRGGPTIIELRSSGAAVDEMLLKLLRGAIRTRGGDVQLVLGR